MYFDAQRMVSSNEKYPFLPDKRHYVVGGEYAKRLNRAVSGAQRLCAWESFYCECIPKCRSRGPNLTMCDLVMRPRKDEPTDPHFVPRSTLHQIEVFDAQNFNPGTNPVLLIDRMPNLRALRWIHPKNSSMLRSILEHPVNQRFVHLDIKLDVNQVRHLETSIHFTALETLHLEYHSVTPNKPEYGDTVLASWAVFPKLHQLVMDVTIGRNNVEEPISFLTKVGSKLSSLLLTMKVLDSTESEWFKPEMWDLFPSLVKFGPGYTTLTSGIPPPPQNMRPLTIMMKSPRDRLDFYEWQFSIPRLDSFVAACKAWRIEEVIVLDSWEQLRFSRKAWKYHCIKVYRELVENGIGIRDRDGLPIKDAREGI